MSGEGIHLLLLLQDRCRGMVMSRILACFGKVWLHDSCGRFIHHFIGGWYGRVLRWLKVGWREGSVDFFHYILRNHWTILLGKEVWFLEFENLAQIFDFIVFDLLLPNKILGLIKWAQCLDVMARNLGNFFLVHRGNHRYFLIIPWVQALVSCMSHGNSKIVNFNFLNKVLQVFMNWNRILIGFVSEIPLFFTGVLILILHVYTWLKFLRSIIEGSHGTIIGQSLPEVLCVDFILFDMSKVSSYIRYCSWISVIIFVNDWDQWRVGILQDWAELRNKLLRSLAGGILRWSYHHLVQRMLVWWLFLFWTSLRLQFRSIYYLVSIGIEGLITSIGLTCGRILLLLLLL